MVNLNVGGAVVHYNTFSKMLPVSGIRNRKVKFTVYDGPNLCQWNGGRINRDISLTLEMVEGYNKFGITVALTFSNPTIDIHDPIGNNLLSLIDETGKRFGVRNKVILVNEELRKHIIKYHDLELIYSVSGHPSDVVVTDMFIQRYKELETLYDWIVPKFEVVFEPVFYNNVDTSKYELMLNDSCMYACPHWSTHFKSIAMQNTLSKNPWEEIGHKHCYKTEECWLDDFNPHVGSEEDRKLYGEKMGMDYTPAMIGKAISLGYRSFKISGRENPIKTISSEVQGFLKEVNEFI